MAPKGPTVCGRKGGKIDIYQQFGRSSRFEATCSRRNLSAVLVGGLGGNSAHFLPAGRVQHVKGPSILKAGLRQNRTANAVFFSILKISIGGRGALTMAAPTHSAGRVCTKSTTSCAAWVDWHAWAASLYVVSLGGFKPLPARALLVAWRLPAPDPRWPAPVGFALMGGCQRWYLTRLLRAGSWRRSLQSSAPPPLPLRWRRFSVILLMKEKSRR